MIKEIRDKFNSRFTEEKYNSFVNDLNSEFNQHIDFRIAETPVFIPRDLSEVIFKASDEIVSQLLTPEFKKYSENAVPAHLAVPGEDEHTSLLALDFAICKDENGSLIPQLIELQGFASLYCYQVLLDRMTRKNFDIPGTVSNYLNGYDEETYLKKIREVIAGDCSTENVILLEIEPEKQKTYIDFLCTEKFLGIKPVCLSEIIKEGRKLFYKNNGRKIPVEKIYNRVINDELARRTDLKYDFSFQDDLDVKWIAHPNWFFKISKYSLPFLKSRFVPDTKFLCDYKEFPADTENYVLKPLYSFAGVGVKFDVKKSDLESVKESERKDYILQKKINYEPVIKTPDSPAKAELRLLYVWEDKPLLINNLVRLSKGKMMGVDFNKDKTWVGSSIAYFEK